MGTGGQLDGTTEAAAAQREHACVGQLASRIAGVIEAQRARLQGVEGRHRARRVVARRFLNRTSQDQATVPELRDAAAADEVAAERELGTLAHQDV